MKAFISYSLSEDDRFLVAVLGGKLRESAFRPWSNINFFNSELDDMVKMQINGSSLFLGLVMVGGKERKRVLNEWDYAMLHPIPGLLLVEDVASPSRKIPGNVIRFNRSNPGTAIARIQQELTPKESVSAAIVPWIYGGPPLISVLEEVGSDSMVVQQ